jgi:hypothetical protein
MAIIGEVNHRDAEAQRRGRGNADEHGSESMNADRMAGGADGVPGSISVFLPLLRVPVPPWFNPL